MELPYLTSEASEVRAMIAARMLDQVEADRQVGAVTLAPHQISAVARIGAAFEEFGGALLFDAVGVGKTYIGAAVAGKASDALVVAPATLRSMWKDAAQRADLKLSFVSTESLSVTEPRSGSWDIVVVDEAHHFRNPNTKRHRRLAEIVRGRRALLMSATPIHNSRNDLVSVASLFLGARAGRLSDSELGRLIIRRDREEAGISAQFPVEESTEWITGSDRPEIVDAIRALPPPLPLRDAGEATELISRGLVRQWASSEHALAAALRRRLLSAVAMESSLESGRHPSRAELESWLVGDEGVQLGFAELLSPIADAEVGDLLAAVRQHSAGLRSLLELLGRSYSMDAERAQQLSDIRRRHAGCRIVAFSAYAATVRALFELLAREGGVALLTSAGGRVIGGKITRAEILRQFSPESQQRSCLDAMKIDLLLTTDLLSEGVNLQDAAVAIHLDLPWTHARIEQRTGRIARLGSRHRSVAIYGFKPPKSADDFLRSSSLVERKLLDSVGVAAQPAMHERVRATISRWKATSSTRTARVPLVAAVQSQHDGFLALVICGARPQLICWSGDRITDQAFEVAMSCECAEGISARVLPHEARAAVAAVAQWLLRQSAASAAGLGADSYLAGRGRLIAGIDSVAARSSPARRSRMLRLVAVARDVATRTHGASVESELAELASAELKNEEWLRRIAELGSAGRKRSAVSGTAILAVLLLTRSPLKGGMCK